jgi:hypothetical protein
MPLVISALSSSHLINRYAQVNGLGNSIQNKSTCTKSRLLLYAMTLFILLLPMPALPALGEDDASIQTDQEYLNAPQNNKIITPQNTIYEFQTSTGTVIREYLAVSGVVFAITWTGPVMPNLRLLMGTYFTQYVEAANNEHGSHGHLVIQQPDLIVESTGHMRAFFGRAYLPDMVPQGVTMSMIR